MIKLFSTLLITTILLSACGAQTDIETQTANHIGRPAFMVERQINTGNFKLMAWERMHQRNTTANVYIEGDGIIQKTKINAGSTPTPSNPVALHLASRDKAENLVYLSRPCQFLKMPQDKGCTEKYWLEDRYAPEVIDAYEIALNDIAARYDISGFHLIGYDGGGNIAAILAARRPDVLTLRTVAGNLNPDFATEQKPSRILSGKSIRAIDYGTALAGIPQHHFIGAVDREVTPGVYHSYRQAVGLSDCIHYSMVPDADHERGWVEKWPALLALEPQCAKVYTDLPPLPAMEPISPYKGPVEPKYSK